MRQLSFQTDGQTYASANVLCFLPRGRPSDADKVVFARHRPSRPIRQFLLQSHLHPTVPLRGHLHVPIRARPQPQLFPRAH